MFIRMIMVCVLTFTVCLGEEKQRELKVNGIGKMAVKADVAEIRLGIEVEASSAKDVEEALSQHIPLLLESLTVEKVEKLETGMLDIHPEYTESSPPQIKSYRGRILISFFTPVLEAGKIISDAFSAGANLLVQVRVRPSHANLETARSITLKEASKNALKEAQLVLESLNLKKKEISAIVVYPSDSGMPLYRNEATMMTSFKNTSDLQILEGEQMVQSQIEMTIQFRDN
ncbi:hypothetical protein PHSC3_000647 [Chlamydiales bacterium STE3]|nr:hypothetical protein PHSC3_000647 [Chlamydiales bacterium STE3]